MFNTPILFLVFNRPDTTARVFEQIRKIKPSHLYVAGDGPREDKPGEKEKTVVVRQIVLSGIDWECEVKTLFRDENLGCGKAVSQAIYWFFDNVEEGIILEDDTLPDLSFFHFCTEILAKYKNDQKVMHISGNNFQFGSKRGNGDYYFSKYTHIWGWATWRRAWNHYDFDISQWRNFQLNGLEQILKEDIQIVFWKKIFDTVYSKEIDTWDYQWLHAIWLNKALCILPNMNLVINIGFGENATHTVETNEIIDNLQMESLTSFNNPGEYDKAADDYSFYHLFNPSVGNLVSPKLLHRITGFIKRVFKKLFDNLFIV